MRLTSSPLLLGPLAALAAACTAGLGLDTALPDRAGDAADTTEDTRTADVTEDLVDAGASVDVDADEVGGDAPDADTTDVALDPVECVADALNCNANVLERCIDGRWEAHVDCEGPACTAPFGCVCDTAVAGCAALICEPEAVRCGETGERESCATDGRSWVSRPCGRDEVCVDGACETSACAGMPCDDGNDAMCDGCEDCAPQRVLVVDAALDVEPASIVVPDAYTVEWWMQTSSSDIDLVTVAVSGRRWSVGVVGGALRLVAGGASDGERVGPSINDGAWHHVAIVKRGQHVLGYVDGRAVFALPGLALVREAVTLSLGCEACDGEAELDDLRVSTAPRYTGAFAPPTRLSSDDLTLRWDGFDTDSALPDPEWLNIRAGQTRPDTCRGLAACGDGVLAAWERCDDGNTIDGDGCSAGCDAEWTCAEGVSTGGGVCLVKTDATHTGDWAETGCDRFRDVAVPASLTTWDDIAVALSLNEDERVWLGLSDAANEGVWVWHDGTPLDPEVSYWAPDEPNASTSAEDYAHMWQYGTWNDAARDQRYRVLCAMPAVDGR